jgi:single-stranded DNA-binding protein
MKNNHVTLVDNLGRDPEIRQVGQQKVAKLSLGVGSGKAQWFRLTAFDKVATECEALHIGALVQLEGRRHASSYAVDGARRYAVAVIIDSIRSIVRKDAPAR